MGNVNRPRIVISFYNKVAQDWKQDGSYIQMRLPDPHSAVTSQQQLERITGTVGYCHTALPGSRGFSTKHPDG